MLFNCAICKEILLILEGLLHVPYTGIKSFLECTSKWIPTKEVPEKGKYIGWEVETSH